MKWFAPLLVLLSLFLAGRVPAHDMDTPEYDTWFESLRQPNNPTASCCGKSDHYWCDGIHVRSGKTYCTITDDRPNEQWHRTPRALGLEIEIPDNKLGHYPGNPTGHSIVFLGSGTEPVVYCFVQGGGI